MKTNLDHLEIKLDVCEADRMRRELETIKTVCPDGIPYNGKLAELLHVVTVYSGKYHQ